VGTEEIRIALVILQDTRGHIALQLRSPIPTIVNPDHWGIFGGHIEPGESPETAAIREIAEELTIQLDAGKLSFVESFDLTPSKQYFVFHYSITNEFNEAELMEGEDFDLFPPSEISSGSIRGKNVVSYHIEIIERFVAHRTSQVSSS
jgi:8-oxo-dGTP pyrophosphatase MutT (NUDIX family)